MKKLDFLEKDYEYQRAWITHANSASAIGLTISGLFSSWVLINNIQVLFDHKIIGFIFILFFALSIFNYIKVIFPSFKKSNSIIYFNGIVEMGFEDFKNRVAGLDDEKIEVEYIEQIFTLAKIAKRKFESFRIALCYSLVTLVGSVIILLLNISFVS